MEPQHLTSQDERILVTCQARWQKVADMFYESNPYNCIGVVATVSPQGKIVGNGFLITNCLVLTSAHLLCSYSKNQILQFQPKRFYFNVKGKLDENDEINSTRILQYKICPQYLEVLQKNRKLCAEMVTVRKSNLPKTELQSQVARIKQQAYQLKKQSQKYDYALLQTQKIIKRNKYFHFYDLHQANLPNQIVTICGYLKIEQSYRLYQGSNKGQITQTSMIYDIDTAQGQSGSPVFLANNKLTLVGIHKGFDSLLHRNVCTIVSRQMLQYFQEWSQKFGFPSIFLKPPENKPIPPIPLPQPTRNLAIQPSYQMHPDNSNLFDVKVTKTNYIVKRKHQKGKNYSYILNGHIPTEQTTLYQIKQSKTKFNYLFTGIATSSAFNKTDVHTGQNADVILYSSRDGAVVAKDLIRKTGSSINDGQIITIQVNLQNWKIRWLKGKMEIASANIHKSMQQTYLYLIIVMLSKDDTAQILDL